MGRGNRNNLHQGVRGNSQVGVKQSEANKTGHYHIAYSKSKNENYLLNKNHPVGKSKAKFFSEELGYNKGDGMKLNKAFNNAIVGKKPIKEVVTDFGTKLTFNVKVKGLNGKSANVTIVIQKDKGKSNYRIITAYPRKRD